MESSDLRELSSIICLQKSIKRLCIFLLEEYLSLENNPSTLFTTGYGRVMGFIIDIALKMVMKILAVIAGIFPDALIYLQSQSILSINRDKLQSISNFLLLQPAFTKA